MLALQLLTSQTDPWWASVSLGQGWAPFQGKGYVCKCHGPLAIYFIIQAVTPKLLAGSPMDCDSYLARPCSLGSYVLFLCLSLLIKKKKKKVGEGV